MKPFMKSSTAVAVLLLAGLLLVLVPAVARAGGPPQPFAFSGQILTIDTGDVDAAGNSGRFRVEDRHVGGVMFGPTLAATGEPFLYTFHTNVPLLTQSGQIHGILAVGPYDLNLNARTQIGATPLPCSLAPPGTPCIGGFLPGLLIEGSATFLTGAQGHGRVSAWIIPMLDDQGHIAGVLAGQIFVIGEAHP